MTYGSEPDLRRERRRGKENRGVESEEEKEKNPVKREGVAGIKEEENQKEMRRGEEKKEGSEKGTGEDEMSLQETKEREYRREERRGEEGRKGGQKSKKR